MCLTGPPRPRGEWLRRRLQSRANNKTTSHPLPSPPTSLTKSTRVLHPSPADFIPQTPAWPALVEAIRSATQRAALPLAQPA